METKKLQIALVEDHAEFRESMAFLLNSAIAYECIAFSDGAHFIDYIYSQNYCPAVVLMDINMPLKNGIDTTRLIKEKYPETLIMMCTVIEDDEKIFDALKSGASGYILKRAAIEEIFAALEDLLNGGSPMSSVIARKVVKSFNKSIQLTTEEYYNLSKRENELLDMLAQGKRIKEIADELFIAVSTVRKHIRNIYEKLQVKSRTEALNKTHRGFK
jgi:DNA-binding NarL/FixJ family response regulator